MRGLVGCFFSRLAAIAGLVEERPAVDTAADACLAPLSRLYIFSTMQHDGLRPVDVA
jgi:hypothetical protein